MLPPKALEFARPISLGMRYAPRLPRLTAGAWLFAGSAAVYASAAIYLVFGMHLVVGDALSRVGNAYYVLFSRDPHLAAIGFVWNPLPSLLIMPILPLKVFWPALVSDGFAANVVSIAAMAAAVAQLWKLLRDWKLPAWEASSLAVLFALHPMVIQYGANGDSEAVFILSLLVLARAATRWLDTRSTGSLALAAIALAVAYLVRYEAVAVALSLAMVVAVAAYTRATGDRSARVVSATADVAILVTPFAAVFIGWAVASWVIVGSPFEQFSSIYGTASQLQAGDLGLGSMSRGAVVAGQVLGLAPLALPLAALAAALAIGLRRPVLLVPLAVFGSVLAFAVVAWLFGKTGGWLRYYVSAVPLAVVSAGALLSGWQWQARPRSFRGLGMAGIGSLALLLVSVGNVSSAFTMRDPALGREDHYKAFDVPRYEVSREIASYVDGMRLPRGSVLIDTFLGSSVVLSSANPEQFVITSDRDFLRSVADPEAFHVGYILVPVGGGLGTLDAIERQWPRMYEDGGGIATLVREFSVPDGENQAWRLYRVRAS